MLWLRGFVDVLVEAVMAAASFLVKMGAGAASVVGAAFGSVWQFLKRRKWLAVVAAGFLAAIIAFQFNESHGTLKRHLEAVLHLAPAPDTYTILLADLDGDDKDFRHTRNLKETLGRERGFRVVDVGKVLRLSLPGREREEEYLSLRQGARDLLQRHDGDVLVFGQVGSGEGETQTLQLGFEARQRGVTAAAGVKNDLQRFEMRTDFTCSANFTEQLRDILVATILAQIAPVTEESGTYLAARMAPLARRIETFLNGSGGQLPPEPRASAWHSLGLALYIIGEQAGDNDALRRAVKAYREALKERTRERVPLNWAATQNNLGNALSSLGEREAGTENLQGAVKAYREALKERTRERVPLGWAMTQNNLGVALISIAARTKEKALAEEALGVLQRAREEFHKGAPYYLEINDRQISRAQRLLKDLGGKNARS